MLSVKGSVILLLLFCSSLFGSVFMLGPLLPLMLVSVPWYRWITDRVVAVWFTLPVALMEMVLGVRVVITGDGFVPGERSVIIMNHRTRMDWMYLWNCLLRYSYLRMEKICLKSSLKSIPGFGWAMQVAGFIFIERKWERDRDHLQLMLRHLCDIRQPLQLLIFPEGTDLTASTKGRSDEFAEARGLPRYQYVLHPRTTGFAFIVSQLRKGCSVDAIHDVTVAYPYNIPQSERDLFTGNFPREIHFHIRRYPAAQLPVTQEGLQEWCRLRWLHKERLLRGFYQGERSFRGLDQGQDRSPARSAGPGQDRSPDQALDRSAGPGQDRSPDRALDRSPDRSPDQALDRSPDRSPDQALDRSAGPGQDRSPDRALDRSAGPGQDRSPDRALDRSTGRGQDRSPDRSAGQGQDQSAGQDQDRSLDRALDRSAGQGQDRSLNQGLDQDRSLEQGLDRIRDQGLDQGQDRSLEQGLDRIRDQGLDWSPERERHAAQQQGESRRRRWGQGWGRRLGHPRMWFEGRGRAWLGRSRGQDQGRSRAGLVRSGLPQVLVPPCKSRGRVFLIKLFSMVYWTAFVLGAIGLLWSYTLVRWYFSTVAIFFILQERLFGGIEMMEMAAHQRAQRHSKKH